MRCQAPIFGWYSIVLIVCLPPIETSAADRPATAPSSPAVSFLTAEETRKAIADDSTDSFLSILKPAAMSSLTGEPITGDTLEEQRAECRRRFQEGAREFSAREQTAIRSLIEDISPKLAEQYPLFASTPWRFIKLSNDLCGGMSHTRGRHIVFSEGVSRFMIGAASRKSAPARPQAVELLVHEQMHVVQRAYPELFDTLATRVLGYEFCENLKSHPYLVEHLLPNPDGPDCRWILPMRQGDATTYILPLMLLNEGEGLRRLPLELRQVAVSLEKTDEGYRPKADSSGKPVMRSLRRVPAYIRRFNGSPNAYHPNEAGADLFAKLFLMETGLGRNATQRRDLGPEDEPEWPGAEEASYEQIQAEARRWFRKHLADNR